MPVLKIRSRKPSLFVPNSNPEATQGTQESGGTTTKASQPNASPTAFQFPTLSLLRPNDAIIPPEELYRQGRAIIFPAIKPEAGGILSVKYLNEWQLTEKQGGGRSSSKRRGYNGYRGREVKFTTMLNDIDMTTATRSSSDVIDLLRTWATMETTQAWVERPIQVIRIMWNHAVSWERKIELEKEAMETLSGKTPNAFKEKYANVIEKFSPKSTGQVTEPELTDLDNPIPALPLSFRLGNLVVSPCVIKKVDIKVFRFDRDRITSAEIKVVLQEIMSNDVWMVKDTPRARIVAAKTVINRAGEPDRPRGTASGVLEAVANLFY